MRSQPGDFLVEELPTGEATGSGEHLLVAVEKRSITHAAMMARVARALKIPTRDIGSAGRKDRHAVTRQWISVPASCEAELQHIDCDELTVLSSARHARKVRTGQLLGNRFEITLRSPAGEPAGSISDTHETAARTLQDVSTQGMPNYFGPQRFGHGGSSIRDGLRLLTGTVARRRFLKEHSESHLRFALSAVQSAAFNLLLADRVESGSHSTVRSGDVVRIPGSERWFAENSARIDRDQAGSLVIGGPMFGGRMPRSDLQVRRQEEEILERLKLTPEDFDRYRKLTPGTRRPLVVKPQNGSVEAIETDTGPGVRIRFDLPAGSYATVLLRELFSDVRDAAVDGSQRSAASSESLRPDH